MIRAPSFPCFLAALFAAAASSLSPRPACAQSIPTGQLERLFGEPVTSSATGMPERVGDAPADMTIITAADIRRSGATNIPEILQYVPGLDVRWYGIADAEVGVDGYNQPYNPRLLVLVDGRQVYLDDYGHVNWASIPVQLDDIRQIEVIRGPNSALYGFNAVDGVINILTYDPLHDDRNSASVGIGAPGQFIGSLTSTLHLGESAGVRVSLGGLKAQDFSSDGLDAVNAEARRPPLIGTSSIASRIALSPNVSLYVAGSLTSSRTAEMNYTGGFDTLYLQTNSFRTELDADTRFGIFALNFYRNGVHEDFATPVLSGLPSWADQRVYVVQGSDLLQLDPTNTVRLGIEYRNNAGTAPGIVGGTIGYRDLAANAMWHWRITPRLSLTNAVRVDWLALHYTGALLPQTGITAADYARGGFTVPSFNSGLVYRPTDRDTLRLLAAQGMQAPSLADFALHFPAGTLEPVAVSGSPALAPAVVDSVSLGWDHRIDALASTLRSTIFAAHNRDLIAGPGTAPITLGPLGVPVLLAENVGTSNALGFRLGLSGHVRSGWRWSASYAFVTTTNGTDLDRGPVMTAPVDYANSVPRNTITLGVGRTFGKFALDLFARWQSSFIDFRTTRVDGALLTSPVVAPNYVSLSGRLAYHLTPAVTLSLVGQQFNAASLVETAGPSVERQVIGLVTIGY